MLHVDGYILLGIVNRVIPSRRSQFIPSLLPYTATAHNINGSRIPFRMHIEDLLVLSNNDIENFLKKTKTKYSHHSEHVKVGFVCFNESPLKMMEKTFF